ncbi:MAG: glycosyltransferase family 4 protein [Saprospiraceae bacterium]|nr:glycosyltransferase family 4 protein [Saprospiraceae bacterium]MCB9326993.1 glycosyltransferase family 4 protein [Lewinellaceae bacterium]
MLNIGFDAKRLFNNFTGLGNYSRTLLLDLSANFPEEVYFLYTPKVKSLPATNFFLNSPGFQVHRPKRAQKVFWRSLGIKKMLKKHEIDVFHGLSHEIPLGIQHTGIKSVVTIHDLIFKHYPKQYKPIDNLIYDAKFKYACRHADKIVAISESTRKDIIDFYHIDPEKIEVIYQSCNDQFKQKWTVGKINAVLEKYNLPQDFILYVGSVIERKNLLNIVKAIKILPKNVTPHLVVVGEGSAYKNKVHEFLAEHGMEEQVSFIAPVFEDIPALYQQAKVFVYPSVYEGFGIPVIEALYSHTPVVTSNVSSLPEAGGPDTLQVDPASIEALAEAIEKALTDEQLRQHMITKGYEYVKKFDGDEAAIQMMEMYRKLNIM